MKEDALPKDTVVAVGKIQPGGQVFAKPQLSYPALEEKKSDQQPDQGTATIPVCLCTKHLSLFCN